MIRIRESVLLARAKLKTRKIRLGIIVVISSLVFAVLVFAGLFINGAIHSVQSFSKEGLGGRYIINANPIIDTALMYNNTALIDSLRPTQDQLIKDKKAYAKKYNMPYDAKTDQNLPIQEFSYNGETHTSLNLVNPVVSNAIHTTIQQLPHVDYGSFQELAKKYGAKTTYKSSAPFSFFGGQNNSKVSIITNGQETDSKQQDNGPPKGVSVMLYGGWKQFDPQLLKPFLLRGQTLAVGTDGSIPVLAPVSGAEQALSLDPLPSTASSADRLERLGTLRQKIAGKTAQICYRNAESANLIERAKQQADDFAKNGKSKDYKAPALQYALPAEACGAVTVKKDTRTADEKKQDDIELNFKKQFEGYQEPQQGIITVRIVGIVADVDYSTSFSMTSVMRQLLQSTLGQGWFSPNGSIPAGSLAAQINKPLDGATGADLNYYAEFNSVDAARKFVDSQTCKARQSGGNLSEADPRVAACYKQGKYFDLQPFSNNEAALSSVRKGFWKIMRYVMLVVVVIAALILMGVVGKIISDGRRETAVFRALGATRFSIVQIYLTYAFFVALLVAICSFAFGCIAAYVISAKLSPAASPPAVLTYNSADLHKQFTFWAVDYKYLALVFALIIAAALLSAFIPLLTNIRRNPIKDMRDEA